MADEKLRFRIGKSLMKNWMKQIATGSGMINDPPVTHLSVKESQIDAIEAIVVGEKADLLERMKAKFESDHPSVATMRGWINNELENLTQQEDI